MAARTSLQRMQESRARTSNTYSKARNGAEREVVLVVKGEWPKLYETMAALVAKEHPDLGRVIRQARIRSAVCAWYRSEHRDEWNAVFDRHVRDRAAESAVPIVRREGAKPHNGSTEPS